MQERRKRGVKELGEREEEAEEEGNEVERLKRWGEGTEMG